MQKALKYCLLGILFLLLASTAYFFVGRSPAAGNIVWGVNFSQKHARDLGLDWQETYSVLLDDLKVREFKLITHWDLLEPGAGQYSFQDLDWQVKQAEERKANLLLVMGMKTPRWPECHIPVWARDLSREEQQGSILRLLREVVLRYQGSPALKMWQVENEPFFPFGECPWTDKEFVKKEITLVKSLDRRPILISDSGEFSFWLRTARLGDVVGTTIYKKAWFRQLNSYINYPLPAVFYWRKAQLIKWLFDKEVVGVELQAEPWCPVLLYDCSPEEQAKTMNLEMFRDNIAFARRTGLTKFYLWGAEWWFWLKETQQDHQLWEEARILFDIF